MSSGRPVCIVGGGGLGREIRDYLAAAGREFAGFLDDAEGISDCVGGLDDAARLDADLLIGVGSVDARRKLVSRLGSLIVYTTLVHPTAVVSLSAHLAVGAVVGPFCFVGPGARMESHSLLNIHSMMGHDGELGEMAVVSPHVVLAGDSKVGSACFIGSAAVVFQGVTVGAYSVVSAGSMLTKDVPENSFVAGNPARSMPRLDDR